MSRIGVLALQGAFAAHAKVLQELGHQVVELRSASQLNGLQGLVLPGGESTAQWKLLEGAALEKPLDGWVRKGTAPVLATCAGLILAAMKVTSPEQKSFGWLEVTVARNGWGRQVNSFETDIRIAFQNEEHPMQTVFIRAPRITHISPGLSVIPQHDREAIAVQQRNVTGVTFHPELSGDASLHRSIFGAET